MSFLLVFVWEILYNRVSINNNKEGIMPKQLTNKQTEVIAHSLAKQIFAEADEKARKQPEVQEAMKAFEALIKKRDKFAKQEREVSEEMNLFRKDFNEKHGKKIKIEHNYPYERVSFNVFPARYDKWQLRQEIETDLTIQMIRLNHDIDAVMEEIKKKYSI
jgi:molybdopterin converting factor small subunit|tara:strand:+ start:26 stop:508 length:483 start_codon:yes stop_codon:yes gene_type:complete